MTDKQMVKDAEKQAPTPQNQVRRKIDFPSLLVLLLLLRIARQSRRATLCSPYRVSPRHVMSS